MVEPIEVNSNTPIGAPERPQPAKKRVLFVDDDGCVLDGLRDVMRRDRARWDMAFALSGVAALAEMERSPVDVVVSDMRMPGMDGAALLAEVRARYPMAARIILTGQAERESMLRAIPIAHQCLTKPCDGATLRAAIERTCALQEMIDDEAVRHLVGRLGTLPSVPRTYLLLCDAAAMPDVDIGVVAGIVETDPAMSAKVLQLVNSAYFGFSKRIVSIRQAATCLGLDTLKALSLSGQVFTSMESRFEQRFALRSLQEESFLVAGIARRLVRDPAHTEEAFTAGLLHDVGRVVIGMAVPGPYARVVAEAETTKQPLHLVEKEALGVSHEEAGAYLLGVWGLPLGIVEAVACHHVPTRTSAQPGEVLMAVHVADRLTAMAERSGIGEAAAATLDDLGPFLGVLGRDPRALVREANEFLSNRAAVS